MKSKKVMSREDAFLKVTVHSGHSELTTHCLFKHNPDFLPLDYIRAGELRTF